FIDRQAQTAISCLETSDVSLSTQALKKQNRQTPSSRGSESIYFLKIQKTNFKTSYCFLRKLLKKYFPAATIVCIHT
ncbi:hypothetical protein, partial [Pseudomonas agarici]|uniref:hypothetical protein n=1 Tax=Pseudomonas agarici TaxID=46677 RepID=UPI001B7FE436